MAPALDLSNEVDDVLDEPDVTISVDGTSADFTESDFATFLRLTNDPCVGDPEVILAAPETP